jgi:hypothetical protein
MARYNSASYFDETKKRICSGSDWRKRTSNFVIKYHVCTSVYLVLKKILNFKM